MTGGGKGDFEGGKGIGKGFQGNCHNCGKWGHSKRFCKQVPGKGGVAYGARQAYGVDEQDEQDEQAYEVEERDIQAAWVFNVEPPVPPAWGRLGMAE